MTEREERVGEFLPVLAEDSEVVLKESWQGNLGFLLPLFLAGTHCFPKKLSFEHVILKFKTYE
jgi:hypothetical protein